MTAAETAIAAAIRDIGAAIMALTARMTTQGESLKNDLQKVQDELQAKFATDSNLQKIFDLRANAEKRLTEATKARQTYLDAWERMKAVLVVREGLIDQLETTQGQIAGVRQKHNAEVEKTLNAFLPDSMKVSIDFQANCDNDGMYDPLYKIFGAKGHQPKRIRAVVQKCITPTQFVRMVMKKDLSELVGKEAKVDEQMQKFVGEDGPACLEKLRLFERHEQADVDLLCEGNGLLTVMAIQEIPWDDHASILLNGGPVNEKSPGQRSSAMLPLIALAEETPLIIDQPEDNLDKRLIGTVLMNVLASLKEKRQIIVCTHDPNILVGGDAEQVVVLEAESDRRGKVSNHGSIDNNDIVKTVVDLLEGGKEAFANRQRRYSNPQATS